MKTRLINKVVLQYTNGSGCSVMLFTIRLTDAQIQSIENGASYLEKTDSLTRTEVMLLSRMNTTGFNVTDQDLVFMYECVFQEMLNKATHSNVQDYLDTLGLLDPER